MTVTAAFHSRRGPEGRVAKKDPSSLLNGGGRLALVLLRHGRTAAKVRGQRSGVSNPALLGLEPLPLFELMDSSRFEKKFLNVQRCFANLSTRRTKMDDSPILSGASPMPNLELVSLECKDQEDWTGSDDAYIYINGTKVWESRITSRQTIPITGVSPIPFSSSIDVQLFEEDTAPIDPDDDLGTKTVVASDEGQGVLHKYYKKSGVEYLLSYKVESDGKTPPSGTPGGKAPDGLVSDLPWRREGYYNVSDGYVWFELEDDGYYSVRIKGKHSGVSGSTKYSCCVIISGYRDGKPGQILNEPKSQTLTVGADSTKGTAKKDETFTDFPPVSAADIPNVRKVRILFAKDKSGGNFVDVISSAIGAAGRLHKEADALYTQIKSSESGEDVATAAAS